MYLILIFYQNVSIMLLLKLIMKFYGWVALLLIIVILSSCNSTTVLLANFKNDVINTPPESAQPTGTVNIDAGIGSVVVVSSPKPDLPANKWARVSHPTTPGEPTELTGNFTRFGLGNYGLLASLHIPSGSEVVTVQFEASDKSPLPFGPFLHIDFMPEGDVRIDDSAIRFGQFPRDENFVLSVNLNITQTAATAEITLLGGNASGSINVNVSSNVLSLAHQFGAVQFSVGFQHKASFFVDDIIVTRKNP
jgi:hypothetical protein